VESAACFPELQRGISGYAGITFSIPFCVTFLASRALEGTAHSRRLFIFRQVWLGTPDSPRTFLREKAVYSGAAGATS